MATTAHPPLSSVLPPLICGTATFNNQYNSDPFSLPTNEIVFRALESGIAAFDTSPYYGPSEIILGSALTHPPTLARFPRSSYQLLTKVGRISPTSFDYTPGWLSYSITRSLERLHTTYLDVVYLHDVEFVSAAEVLVAVKFLRTLQEQGIVRYVGISGYPVNVLCDLAEMIQKETGKGLDVVMSYAWFSLQNQGLLSLSKKLRKSGVECVVNASVLGMGLLRSTGVPKDGEESDWHPAPKGLREKVREAARWVESKGERLEAVAIRWGLETWGLEGGNANGGHGLGINVVGVSNVSELNETVRVWESILDGLSPNPSNPTATPAPQTLDHEITPDQSKWSLKRRAEIQELAKGIRDILGEWSDYAWASPDEGFVNTRKVFGAVDEEGRELTNVVIPMAEELEAEHVGLREVVEGEEKAAASAAIGTVGVGGSAV